MDTVVVLVHPLKSGTDFHEKETITWRQAISKPIDNLEEQFNKVFNKYNYPKVIVLPSSEADRSKPDLEQLSDRVEIGSDAIILCDGITLRELNNSTYPNWGALAEKIAELKGVDTRFIFGGFTASDCVSSLAKSLNTFANEVYVDEMATEIFYVMLHDTRNSGIETKYFFHISEEESIIKDRQEQVRNKRGLY